MTWSEAFAAYLKRHKIKAYDAAAVLGVAPSTVHYWTKSSEPRGEKGLALKRRIEIWSKGEVKAAPWTEPPEAESGTDVTAPAARAS
jgi:hypothetical protein